MRKFPVRVRLTAWLTMLTAFLGILLVVFMLAISRKIASQTAKDQLILAVKQNLGQIQTRQGKPQLGTMFRFYQNGVTTLIYSKRESLLAGQIPVSFEAGEPFRNGMVRTVDAGEIQYLVLDLWLSEGWENGVWVRGLIETPDHRLAAHNLLKVALIALPVFLIFAAAGSYWIIRRAFRPLDSINATAAAINEARDLSRRIGLPPGQDEFSRLGMTFDSLFERLERSFEAEKQFTSDASHELRTPVSIIKGACDYALKYDETPQDRQESLEMIKRQAGKMSVIISQLLSMTRLEQGTEQVQMETVELYGFLHELCEEQAYDVQRVRITDGVPVNIQANAGLLSVLVRNLVENAIKYGKPDGHVWLSVQSRDGGVQLLVQDDGEGIAKEHQEKIWQRFYQADTAHSGEMGAGLGLPMVQQIAKIHGGFMTLESGPETGSLFILHLPDADAWFRHTPEQKIRGKKHPDR